MEIEHKKREIAPRKKGIEGNILYIGPAHSPMPVHKYGGQKIMDQSTLIKKIQKNYKKAESKS